MQLSLDGFSNKKIMNHKRIIKFMVRVKCPASSSWHLKFISRSVKYTKATLYRRTTAKRQSKNMLTFLKFCLFFHFAFLSEARETQLDPDSSVRFDYFVEHRFHYLEVPNKTESKVSEFVDCAMECLKSSKCLSLNMAAASDNEKILLCELLFADMFSNPQGLRENATSHHFSKWVSLKINFECLSFCSLFQAFRIIVNLWGVAQRIAPPKKRRAGWQFLRLFPLTFHCLTSEQVRKLHFFTKAGFCGRYAVNLQQIAKYATNSFIQVMRRITQIKFGLINLSRPLFLFQLFLFTY